jgi:hypothetical protein
MNTTFDPARSAALRQQLATLPPTDAPALAGHAPDPRQRGRRAPWVIGGTVVAVTVGLLAWAPFQPTSTTGGDFIPAMARPQQPQDQLPEEILKDGVGADGTDTGTSRLIGAERGHTYYAVEKNDGDQLCLITDNPRESPDPAAFIPAWEAACMPLTNFDSAGMTVTSSTRPVKLWLVSANIAERQEQRTEWTRLSSNLLIQYTEDIPTPGS